MDLEPQLHDTLMAWGGDYRLATTATKLFPTWQKFDEVIKAVIPASHHERYRYERNFRVTETEYDLVEFLNEVFHTFSVTPENVTAVAHFVRYMNYAEHGIPWARGEEDEKLDAFLSVPLDYTLEALPLDRLGLHTRYDAVDLFNAVGEYARRSIPAEYVRDLQLDDAAVYRNTWRVTHLHNAGVPAGYAYKLMMWESDCISILYSYGVPVEYVESHDWPVGLERTEESDTVETIGQLFQAGVPGNYGRMGLDAGIARGVIIESWQAGLPIDYMTAVAAE